MLKLLKHTNTYVERVEVGYSTFADLASSMFKISLIRTLNPEVNIL
jgi:hypothetical protein